MVSKQAVTSTYAKLQPTLKAAGKTITNLSATCKAGLQSIKGLVITTANALKTCVHTLETVGYAGKLVAYDTPAFALAAYGSHVDENGEPLTHEKTQQAIDTAWNTVATDTTNAKDSLTKAANAGLQTIENGADTIIHTTHFVENAGSTVYSAGETLYEAGVVAKDAAAYVVNEGVIPAAQYVSASIGEYITAKSHQHQQELTWLAALKQQTDRHLSELCTVDADNECVMVSRSKLRIIAPAAA